METLEGLKRTDYCGTLTAKDVGRTVTLCGWVQRQRDLGSLIFIDSVSYTHLTLPTKA